MAELAAYPRFNQSDPSVRAYARLADLYLLPWSRIQGVSQGMGAAGMISPILLQAMGAQSVVSQ